MRVAIYVRVSTQRQAQANTSALQLERLRAHLQGENYQLPDLDVFDDQGYSGFWLKRPALDRLRDAVAQGLYDRLLMTSPDRLARNYVHQVLLLEELQSQGCRVEFLDRPLSQDPHDQLLLQVRGAVAEYERTLIAERTRRGRLAKLKAGSLLPWTVPPYGYRTDPDRSRDPATVRVEEAQGAIVQEIFASYLRPGATLYSLAHELQARGAADPTRAAVVASRHAAWHPEQPGVYWTALRATQGTEAGGGPPITTAAGRASQILLSPPAAGTLAVGGADPVAGQRGAVRTSAGETLSQSTLRPPQ
jgi:site-specific DNA recombinase